MKRLIICAMVAALAVLMAPLGAFAQDLDPMNQTSITSANPSGQITTPAPSTKTTWGQIRRLYGSDGELKTLPGRGAVPQAIGSRRYAVRNECWYALDRNWLYRGDDPNGPGGDGTMSNWNWLSKSADANGNGLRIALTYYKGCVSDLIPCNCCEIGSLPSPRNTIQYWVDALSSDTYGWGLAYGNYRYKGHGGECPSFVTMVIYRATGGQVFIWKWGQMQEASRPSAKYAQPGDIVFKTSGLHHVAICVRNDGNRITLVDSNYLGNDGQEVIGRHDLTYSQIGTTWKMYSGQGIWY